MFYHNGRRYATNSNYNNKKQHQKYKSKQTEINRK